MKTLLNALSNDFFGIVIILVLMSHDIMTAPIMSTKCVCFGITLLRFFPYGNINYLGYMT
jgi:hypothetical protein